MSETPAEFSTLIDDLLRKQAMLIRLDEGGKFGMLAYSQSEALLREARSALESLYNRQREEITEWKELYSKVADDANSLSSQLKASVARFDDDVASIAYWSKRAIEAESSVERLEAEQTPRPLQTSVQWEPPYPDHETAIVSIRYPYHTAHKPTTLCAIQEPHLIEDCGEFER